MGQSINNSAQLSASAMANARWHRGAMPGGPDHALPGHVLDAAHVSAHARLLAQRRWGGPSAGAAGTGTAGNGAAGNAQPHAHGTTGVSAASPANPAGGAGWLPWLALGGSAAALTGAEVERRRANREAQGNPAGARIPLAVVVLYVIAAVLAALAIYLFLGQS